MLECVVSDRCLLAFRRFLQKICQPRFCSPAGGCCMATYYVDRQKPYNCVFLCVLMGVRRTQLERDVCCAQQRRRLSCAML